MDMYFDIENREFVSREDLLREYAEKVRQGELNAEEVYPHQFIENCRTKWNGTLSTIAELDMKFEDYMLEQNAKIDEAAYTLLSMLAISNYFERNAGVAMYPIDAAEAALRDIGIDACYPYHENEVPCYRSASCGNKHCPFLGGAKPI